MFPKKITNIKLIILTGFILVSCAKVVTVESIRSYLHSGEASEKLEQQQKALNTYYNGKELVENRILELLAQESDLRKEILILESPQEEKRRRKLIISAESPIEKLEALSYYSKRDYDSWELQKKLMQLNEEMGELRSLRNEFSNRISALDNSD